MKNILPDVKIYINRDDTKFALFEQEEVISDVIRVDGYWNPKLLDVVERILSKSFPGNVVDVGAGIGSFTVPLASRFTDKFVFHAFEPLKIVFMQLATNTLLNNLATVKLYNYPLSNEKRRVEYGILDVRHSTNHGSFSFLERINDLRGIPQTEEKDVYEFTTLDYFSLKNVRLIKISGQGMDNEILQGAKETILNNDHPPILFEFWDNDWYQEEKDKIAKFLEEMGYTFNTYVDNYQLAFKNDAKFDFFMSDEPTEISGEYVISEKEHDTDKTLEDQKVYLPK
jgi:FkbM family methyltransferase